MMAELDCEIVDVSPDVARAILEKNTRNRSLRKDYVQKLAAAMQRGEWTVNGEPIQIAGDGTLLNGQHRLSAVVEAEATVRMLVVRGLEIPSQMTMDSGLRRNLSDVLSLHGKNETTNLGAMLGMLHRYRNGHRLDNSGRTAPTPPEALELLEREPGIEDSLPLARKVLREASLRVSATGLLLYIFEEVDPGEGERFFETLCVADDEPVGSPVLALKSILERARTERTYRMSSYVLFAMIIKAFNAWREGRDVFVLAFKPWGSSPEPFPKILSREDVEHVRAGRTSVDVGSVGG
jgi:hypothetical protein